MSKNDKETSNNKITNDIIKTNTDNLSDNEFKPWINRCIICNEDLGIMTQTYCFKWYCPYEGLTNDEIKKLKTPIKKTKPKNIYPNKKRKGMKLISKFDKKKNIIHFK